MIYIGEMRGDGGDGDGRRYYYLWLQPHTENARQEVFFSFHYKQTCPLKVQDQVRGIVDASSSMPPITEFIKNTNIYLS